MRRKNIWGLAGFIFVAAWILGFLFETGAPPQDVLAFYRAHLKAASGWRPRYPSLREGWQAVLNQVKENRQAMSPG